MTSYKSIKYNFSGSDLTGIVGTPTISGISPSSSTESALPVTITITGTSFQSNSTVTFIGSSGTQITSPSVTFNSTTELEATAPTGIGGQNEDPWDVKVENPVTGQGDNLFSIDDNPIFATPAGTLGTIVDSARAAPLYSLSPATATDPEGVTVTYALIAPGPAVSPGLSFDTTNAAITGTADAVGGDVTTTFRVRATAGAQTADRDFSITVKSPVQQYYTTSGVGTVALDFAAPIKVLVVAGGGSGGSTGNSGGGGGGGLISHPSYTTTPKTYSYYIGSGGTGSTTPAGNGENSNWNLGTSGASTDADVLTAIGGGQGTSQPAADGGSGGGRSHSAGPGGATLQANSPLISADAKTYGFGNIGGSNPGASYPHPSGGGGGAGAGGGTPSGGAGKDVGTDFGTSQGSPGGHFAGGGGGGNHTGGGGPGANGGGNGGNPGNAGTAATGSGGGSAAGGGSGIIAIAY